MLKLLYHEDKSLVVLPFPRYRQKISLALKPYTPGLISQAAKVGEKLMNKIESIYDLNPLMERNINNVVAGKQYWMKYLFAHNVPYDAIMNNTVKEKIKEKRTQVFRNELQTNSLCIVR